MATKTLLRQFAGGAVTTDHWIYASAIRAIGRRYGMTWAETVETFGSRLVHVRCNVVTAESVRAILHERAA
jgi:hypothetical protein